MLVTVCFSFGWRYIAERLEQSMVVEPGHPVQHGQFDGLTRFSGSAAMGQFSLVEPIDRLGQGLVVTVSFAAACQTRSMSTLSTSSRSTRAQRNAGLRCCAA